MSKLHRPRREPGINRRGAAFAPRGAMSMRVAITALLLLGSARAHACSYRTWTDTHVGTALATFATAPVDLAADLILLSADAARAGDHKPIDYALSRLEIAHGVLSTGVAAVLIGTTYSGSLGYGRAQDVLEAERARYAGVNIAQFAVGAFVLARGIWAATSASHETQRAVTWRFVPSLGVSPGGSGLCIAGNF